MADPSGLDADRIAELRRQLAEATEQVARVHAELNQVAGDTDAGAAARAAWAAAAEQSPSPYPPLEEALAPVAPAVLERLDDPPRPVPVAFRFAAFSWSWWEGWGVFMGVIAPIALWGFFPVAIPAGFVVGIVLIVVLRGRRNMVRLGLLKWGKVARVTSAEALSTGTYYSGVTYSNVRMRQAHGWDVTRSWYSGPATVTEIGYDLDGTAGSFRLRGLPYDDGVVLAHSRKPGVALCVSSFPYSVKPEDGRLVGRLRFGTWVGIVCTVLVEAALVVGLVFSARASW